MSELSTPSPLDSVSLLGAVSEDAALYSFGLADTNVKKSVEARLKSGCLLCQSEVAACTASIGEMAVALPIEPVAPPVSLRARLMNYAAGSRETGRDMRVVRHGPDGWAPGAVAGSRFKALDGARTFLLELEPGVTFPSHDHSHGCEQCLVVQGSATAAGVSIQPGDFVSMPQGSYHEDLTAGPDGCVLFISYR